MSGANKGFSDKERAEEAAWAKQQVSLVRHVTLMFASSAY